MPRAENLVISTPGVWELVLGNWSKLLAEAV